MKALVNLDSCIDLIKDGKLKSFNVIYGEISEKKEVRVEKEPRETSVDGVTYLTAYAEPMDEYMFLTIGEKNPIKINKKHIVLIAPYDGEMPEEHEFQTWDKTGVAEIKLVSRVYIAE